MRDPGTLQESPAKAAWLSEAAAAELAAMGLVLDGRATAVEGMQPQAGSTHVPRRSISAPDVLNEAYEYEKPCSFSRGLRVELPGASMLFLSGTASVDERGATLYEGDFAAQLLRSYRNLTRLLAAEGASWRDLVKTTCYLRDIDRDYLVFNQVRTAFFAAAGLDPLPASTAVQARLCRPDLLIEIEAIAVVPRP